MRNFIVMIFLYCGIVLFSQGFKHPGMLHTEADFVRIKAQIAANEPSVIAGYNNLKANEWAQSTVGTYPSEIIKRGISGDENYINAARGAHSAYLNAIRWKLSGNVAHANKAVSILNSWAATTKSLGGNSNVSLASGLYGYEFANAAELMRDYSGWKAADFKKFQEWMRVVWYPYAYDFLIRRHGTWEKGTPGHYWSNWGLCNLLTVMSIGILCDDEFIYNQGLAFYKHDKVGTFKTNPLVPLDNNGLTEFLGNLVPVLHADTNSINNFFGQMQESGRDQGHATMALGLAVDICETAWNQGDDLYGYMNDRLLSGIEYVAAYNSLADKLPWTEYWYHDVNTSYANSWKQIEPNSSSRGQFRPYWDRVIGHYEGRKGLKLNYSHKMADLVVADAGAVGSTSGGYDHLGFTTLTCTRSSLDSNKSPLTLNGMVEVNGVVYPQTDLNNVPKGSQMKLVPMLPDGIDDSYNWLWNNGSTTKILSVEADSSAMYRVYYTDVNGVQSSTVFSISVLGDCLPDIYTFSVNTPLGVSSDTVIPLPQNADITISLNSSSWRSTYLWSNGQNTSSQSFNILNADTAFSVTGTNLGGATKVLNFKFLVETLGGSYILENKDKKFGNKITCTPGKNIQLIPIVKKGMEGGSWKWTDESVNSTYEINNIQENKEIKVTYTFEGKSYDYNFSISLVPEEAAFAYWPLDEGIGTTATDNWLGNKASMNASDWSEYGINNNAAYLDGNAASYIQLENDLFSGLNDFTISVWVNPDIIDSWSRIWDFGSGTSSYMFLTPKSNDGYLRFAIKSGAGEQTITTTKLLEVAKWSNVTVTKTGTLAKIYVNGLEVGSNASITISPKDLGPTSQNYIGKSQYADPMYKAYIDELRIYDKGMSKDEISDFIWKIQPLTHGFSLNGASIAYNQLVTAKTGDKLILTPMFKAGINFSGGTWLWNNGSTGRFLTINDLQSPGDYWVEYTNSGKTFRLNYHVALTTDLNSVKTNKDDKFIIFSNGAYKFITPVYPKRVLITDLNGKIIKDFVVIKNETHINLPKDKFYFIKALN